MFIIYPLLKFIFHISTIQILAQCFEPTFINTTYNRYLMMVQITCETVFWSIFYAFQFLTISGFGITRFYAGQEEAKITSILIAVAYISCSGYYVTIDSRIINFIIKYFIALFQFYVLFQVAIYSKKNIRITNANLEFIINQQEDDQTSLDSSSLFTGNAPARGGNNDAPQGASRFLKSIQLKKQMMVSLSVLTVVIVLFNMCSILFVSNLSDFKVFKRNNMSKTCYFILRESIYLICITAICVIMRVRLYLPEFFGNEIHANPEQSGFLGNNDFASRTNTLGQAKVLKLRLNKNRLLDKSLDLESNLTDGLKHLDSCSQI